MADVPITKVNNTNYIKKYCVGNKRAHKSRLKSVSCCVSKVITDYPITQSIRRQYTAVCKTAAAVLSTQKTISHIKSNLSTALLLTMALLLFYRQLYIVYLYSE